MKKRLLATVAVLLAAAMFAGIINMAFALITYTDHEHAGVNCVIDVPGKPLIRIVAYGQMVGDYYSGNGHADRIMVQELFGTTWTTVVAYEDNPTRSAFSAGLGLPNPEYVVKPGQIQVLRDEDTNTNMIHWNIPLVCPATGDKPEVTLPPGKLVVTGFGSIVHAAASNIPIGPAGWKYSLVADYYKGTASFFCVGWGCKWVSVGAAYAGTSAEPRVIVDRIWTWTHA